MIRFYIAYPHTTMAKGVRVWGNDAVPEGVTVQETDDYFLPDSIASQHRLGAMYPIRRTCDFCGGPRPCTRDS